MRNDDLTYTHNFILTAADCNGQREMSPANLVTLIIETATEHANIIGVGFDTMISHGISWVLSRLSVELEAIPSINGRYRLITWVESLNRLYSERNFELIDSDSGKRLGYARTVWMAINMETRRPGDLSILKALERYIIDRPCPIDRQEKLTPFNNPEKESAYRFVTSDIDINRHVTTRRYIELIVDCWDLSFWDTNRIKRFDIAFRHEARYGEIATVSLARQDGDHDCFDASIKCEDNVTTLARLKFVPRQLTSDQL